jgi:pimeloyl-ACP methyl ester carboxylesterase
MNTMKRRAPLPAAASVALLVLLLPMASTTPTAAAALISPAAPPMGPYRSGAAPFRARPRAASASAARDQQQQQDPRRRRNAPDPADLIASCQLRWRNATLDHFSFAEGDDETFPQRYYVCDKHWRRATPAPAPSSAASDNENNSNSDEPALGSAGPIFFYAGNEADVLLYLNHTGLMWENAERFGALLVFAEHRYYGQSRPSKKPPRSVAADDSGAPPTTLAAASARRLRARLAHLSAPQAMADYVKLLRDLRAELRVPADTPVACFGGSYGGMLASWMRMKHPDSIDASVASSAPIFNFVGLDPPYPPDAFAAAVTADATPGVGGASEACAGNVRSGWRALAFLSGHSEEKGAVATQATAAALEEREGAAVARSGVVLRKREDPDSPRLARRRAMAARAMRLCEDAADEDEDDDKSGGSGGGGKGGGGAADLLKRRSGFEAARTWLSSAWDYMAMGDFPYETSYMTNGQGDLPAFPVRAACERLADPSLASWEEQEGEEEEEEGGGGSLAAAAATARERGAARLLEAMTQAAGVFFNYTGADVECYEPAGDGDPLEEEEDDEPQQQRASAQALAVARALLSDDDASALARGAETTAPSPSSSSSSANSGDDPTSLDAFLWDWQYCSEMLMPFGKNGKTDFYWPEPFDLAAAKRSCAENWAGLEPRVGWAVAHFGGRGALRSATRITFPSGALDPWRPGSPLEVPVMVAGASVRAAAGAAGAAAGAAASPSSSSSSPFSSSSSRSPVQLDAFTIPSGAHHIDTFFSDPRDPPDVTAARRRIVDLLSKWLDEARAERAEQRRRELAGGAVAAAAAAAAAEEEDGWRRPRQEQQQQQI